MAQAWQPATELELRLRDALRSGDRDTYFRLLATAELLVPAPPDAVANPARLNWPTVWVRGRTQLTVYTSPQAMQACQNPNPGSFLTMTLGQIAASWPDPQWWLAVNAELPIESYLPAWFIQQLAGGNARIPMPASPAGTSYPAAQNPTQVPGRTQSQMPSRTPSQPPGQAMSQLPGQSPSPFPGQARTPFPSQSPTQFPGQASGQVPGQLPRQGPSQPGQLPGRMPSQMPGQAAAPTTAIAAVPAARPPASALSGSATRQAAGGDFVPANSSEQALFDAVARGDNDRFLKILLGTQVIVPISPDAPENIRPGDRGFHWGTAELKGQCSVLLFTSVERMREQIGNVRYVAADFSRLVQVWPHADWAMALNPGTEVSTTLPGEQVRELTGAVGQARGDPALAAGPPSITSASRPANPARSPAPPRSTAALPAPASATPSSPAARPGSPYGLSGTGGSPSGVIPYAAPTVVSPSGAGAASQAQTAIAAGPPPRQPQRQMPVMQKIIPHTQVVWYLERGYDRINGCVYQATDVIDLETPRRLYDTLGLLGPGSGFSPADRMVYVIRWPARFPDLYRTPYREQGDEVPRGTGTMPIYKVGGLRLPHGAEMYVIGADGAQRFVAVFDADRQSWLRAQVE